MKALPLNTIQPVCWQCGEDKLVNFFKHFSQHYRKTKYHPTCKKCMIKEYKKYYTRYNDHKYCIFLMCRKFNYPFKTNIVEGALSQFESPTKSKSKTEVPWGTYLGKIPAYANNKKLTLNEFEDAETEYTENSEENNFDISEELKYKWGDNLSYDDYKYLEYKYNRLSQNLIIDEGIETLIVLACHSSLELRNLISESSTDSKRINDLNKRIQELIKNLGMDANSKVQRDSGKLLNTLGMEVMDYEETSPIDLLGKCKTLEDVNNLDKYLLDYHYRPTRNNVTNSRDFRIEKED